MLRKFLLLSLLATNAINLQAQQVQQQTLPPHQTSARDHGTFFQFDIGAGYGRLYDRGEGNNSFNLAFHSMGRLGYDFGGFYINTGIGLLLLGDHDARYYYYQRETSRSYELMLDIPAGIGLNFKLDDATHLLLGAEASLNPCLSRGDVYKMISPNASFVWKNRKGNFVGFHFKGFFNIEDSPKDFSPRYIGLGLSFR